MRFFFSHPYIGSFLLMAALAGCDQVQEARNTASALKAASSAAANMEQEVAVAAGRAEERRAKGDTLAIPYKELQQYLPASVGDYQPAGEPEGSMMSATGMSYSSCSRTYQKGPEDDPQTLKVSMVDYNGAAGMYLGATAMLGANFQMENDEQRMQGVDLGVPDVKAVEVYRKRDHQASLTAGVGQRFFISIEASGQPDTELVKSVAKDLPLEKLARR